MIGLLRPGPHGAVPGSGIKTGRGSCWIFLSNAEAPPAALAGAVATLLATLAATLAATFSIVTFFIAITNNSPPAP